MPSRPPSTMGRSRSAPCPTETLPCWWRSKITAAHTRFGAAARRAALPRTYHMSSRSRTAPIAENAAAFDHFRDFGRHLLFPRGIAVLDLLERVAREDRQVFLVEVIQLLDAV